MEQSVPGYEKLYNSLSKVADLVIINVLWIVCCIPVVTIGAATSALYYITYQLLEGTESSHIVRSYFKAFRENMKSATLVWLVSFLVGTVLALNVYILRISAIPFRTAVSFLIYVIVFLLCIFQVYIYPVLALFKDDFRTKLRNAALMSIANLLTSIAMLAMWSIPILLSVFCANDAVILIVFYHLIGYSFVAYVNTRLLKKTFTKCLNKSK